MWEMTMMNSKFLMAGALMLGIAGSAQATTLNTIDLTALEGSWSTLSAATPVRLSFGSLGMGTVSVASVNGGAFINAQTPVFGLDFRYVYEATLGSGDTLHSLVNGTSVFSIGSPTAGAPSGFNLTFALDDGDFAAGTAFIIGSLDKNAGTTLQAFSPGAGFGAMDSAALSSDGIGPMVATGAGGLGTLYENSVPGVSDTRAFQLTGAQNSFTIQMLQSPGGSGGISFAVALPEAAVPEPATWAMMIAGFGLVGGMMRRRKVALNFA